MLYVNRVRFNHTKNRFGVVDTDDDVETMCSWDDIDLAVCGYGLDVKGVEVCDGKQDATFPFILNIQPYQDKRYVTRQQLRLKLHAGVNLTIWRNELVRFVVDCRVWNSDVTFRLSDFCTYMNSDVPSMWINPKRAEHKITVILDDKVKIAGDNFGLFQFGVYWDLSEVTDIMLLARMWNYMLLDRPGDDSWKKYWVDKHQRIETHQIIF